MSNALASTPAVSRPLPRMDTPPPAVAFVEPPPVSEVALQAEALLGYNAARLAEERRVAEATLEARTYADECALFEACVAIGVRPFARAAVDAYKASALAEKSASERHPERGREWKWVRHPLSAVRRRDVEWLVQGRYEGPATQADVDRWLDQEVAYNGEVPEGALKIAVALKLKLPAATFEIDSLERHRVPVDPFLIARFGLAEFYVAVWDEPKFDARFE